MKFEKNETRNVRNNFQNSKIEEKENAVGTMKWKILGSNKNMSKYVLFKLYQRTYMMILPIIQCVENDQFYKYQGKDALSSQLSKKGYSPCPQ